MFNNGWNLHGLTTKENKAPTQLLILKTEINIEHDQLVLLQHNINPLRQTENYGIDIYENNLEFVLNAFTFTPCTH